MGMLRMSIEGQKRAKIMEMVKAKKIKQKEAADLIGVSYRQAKRIFKEYCDRGDEALNHGLIGKAGNHRLDEEERTRIIDIVRNDIKKCQNIVPGGSEKNISGK